VNGIEGRIERLELAEGGNPCPTCGRPPADDRVVTAVVVRPHGRPGREPEDGPPPGSRPWKEPPGCPHCGRPDQVIRELYEDSEGRLWEYPDVRPEAD